MTTVTVPLDVPIARGETTIDSVQIRKPGPGELRGLKMIDVAQIETSTMIKLLPRITTPTLTEADVATMDLGDFMACASEVASFLLTKAMTADFPAT